MDELVKALRLCGHETEIIGYCGDQCPYANDGDCMNTVLRDAANAIEKLTGIKDKLILNICSHCDSHLAGCEDCPIIKDINEVFNEQ